LSPAPPVNEVKINSATSEIEVNTDFFGEHTVKVVATDKWNNTTSTADFLIKAVCGPITEVPGHCVDTPLIA
jgi:hypothetical protein